MNSSKILIIFQRDIQRKEEESEETYYQRIFHKHEDESKTQYKKRIEALKSELPRLSVWENKEYEKYTSVYLSASKTTKSSKSLKTTEESTSTHTSTDQRTTEQGSSAKVVGTRSLVSATIVNAFSLKKIILW